MSQQAEAPLREGTDMSHNEIQATVIPWEHAPAISSPFAASALLVCHTETEARRLYVNTTDGYDHAHLAGVANALIEEFSAGNLDDQWQDCGDGSFARFIPSDLHRKGDTAGVR